MSSLKIGRSHKARKALFTRGIRRGYLVLAEIDEALPSGSLTDAERWLLFYSLHAARVEVRDSEGRSVDMKAHAGPQPEALAGAVPQRPRSHPAAPQGQAGKAKRAQGRSPPPQRVQARGTGRAVAPEVEGDSADDLH